MWSKIWSGVKSIFASKGGTKGARHPYPPSTPLIPLSGILRRKRRENAAHFGLEGSQRMIMSLSIE